MKNIIILFAMALLTTNVLAQEKEDVQQADYEFCESVKGFMKSLEALDQANETGSMDDLNKAYKKADKAWNKMEKKAAKLEKVDIKESVKAYNKLVKSVNKIEGDVKTVDDADQINGNIDLTVSEIENILNVECK